MSKYIEPKLSPSKMISYKECPLKYKFNYVDQIKYRLGKEGRVGKKSKASPQSFFGMMMHSIIENTDITNLKSLAKSLLKFKSEYNFLKDEMMGSTTKLSKVMFDYLSKWKDTEKIMEAKIEYRISDSELLEGRVDAIAYNEDGTADIFDWKLYRKIEDLSEDHINIQFKSYALLLWKGKCSNPKFKNVEPSKISIRIFYPFQNHEKVIKFSNQEIEDFDKTIDGIFSAITMLSQDDATYKEALARANEIRIIKDLNGQPMKNNDGEIILRRDAPACSYCQYMRLCEKRIRWEIFKSEGKLTIGSVTDNALKS